jgi:thiol-disulfide isomerase/thioredoxin
MQHKTTFVIVILLGAIVLAACAGGAATQDAMAEKTVEVTAMEKSTAEQMMEKSADEAMAHGTTPETMMDKSTLDAMMDRSNPEAMEETATPETMIEEDIAMPDWFSASLTDVRSGETFTISDLRGKVVLVETMAMWCSNCLKQQIQVLELHSLISERDDFISLGLDIDPNEVDEALQSYTDKNGFYWRYAVSPADVSREIGQLYGDQFLNPPSTPMLIIDRHGQAHPLPFGIKNAQSLLAALEPFLAEGM